MFLISVYVSRSIPLLFPYLYLNFSLLLPSPCRCLSLPPSLPSSLPPSVPLFISPFAPPLCLPSLFPHYPFPPPPPLSLARVLSVHMYLSATTPSPLSVSRYSYTCLFMITKIFFGGIGTTQMSPISWTPALLFQYHCHRIYRWCQFLN